MFYGFNTSNENAAIAALLVYGTYRSRDVRRLKVTPELWATIERAVKSSAKRALDLHDFLEKLKPKLFCSSLKPRFMRTDLDTVTMAVDPLTGELMEIRDEGKRQFWVELLESADHQAVLDILYRKTAWVIALVRDRLERERPLEASGVLREDEEVEAEWHEADGS